MPSRPSLPGRPAPLAGNEQPGHDHTPHHKPAPPNPLRQNPAQHPQPASTPQENKHPPTTPQPRQGAYTRHSIQEHPHNNSGTGTSTNASRSPEPTPTTTPNQTCDDQHESEAGHPAFGKYGPADLQQEEENGRTTNQQNQKTKASTKTHPTIRLSTIERDASNTQRNVFQKQHA